MLDSIQTPHNETVWQGYCPAAFSQQPSAQVYRQFVGAALPDDKLFVVLGTDSGLLLEYLASIATTGQRYVCVDFAPVIEAIQHSDKASAWPAGFKVELTTFDEFVFEQLYQQHQDYVMRNAIILLKSLLVHHETPPYQGVFRTLEEAFHRFRIDRVDNRNFKKVFDCQLANVCDLMHPLSKIKASLDPNVPAIILGGGPSLDTLIPWIKAQQGRLFIFAAARICKRLQQEGIDPDFIGVFDPQPLMFEYAKEMYPFYERSILITGEHPYPNIIRQWRGLKTYSRRRFPWARNSEEAFISDGPTVTNALFGIAVYLGARTLYLAGVDYCFTLDGVCHEASSIESTLKLRDRVDTYAHNYRGEKVGTNIQLYDARNLFEEQLARLIQTQTQTQADSVLTVCNLNDGAAVIAGVEYCPVTELKAFLPDTLPVTKGSVVQQFAQTLAFDADSTAQFLHQLHAQVAQDRAWFKRIVREATQGQQMLSTLFADPKKLPQRINLLLKQKIKLETLVGPDYQTLVNYADEAFMVSLQPVNSTQNMSQHEIENALKGFFDGLCAGAEGFLTQLTTVDTQISERQTELTRPGDFESLAQRWLKQDVPGRFYVWLDHMAPHPLSYYQQHFPQWVSALQARYAFLMEDNSALEQRFNDRLDDPLLLIDELKNAFAQRSMHAIQTTQRQLQSMHFAPYFWIAQFAQGLVLELHSQPQAALDAYSELADSFLSCKTEALTAAQHQLNLALQERVYAVAIALKAYDVALKALQILSELNPAYLSLFAKMLALLGNAEGAIAVLQQRLLAASDTNVLLQLAQLLWQTGKRTECHALLDSNKHNPSFDQTALAELRQTLS